MLKIAITINNVFKRVFLLLLFLEIILLGIELLIYSKNTTQVSSDMKENAKKVMIGYRDLFVEYMSNKYILLIDDILLILKTYSGIVSWKQIRDNDIAFSKYTSQYILENCSMNGNLVPNTGINQLDWFTDPSMIIRMKGTWYNGLSQLKLEDLSQDNYQKVVNLCVMNDILKEIIMKNLRWKDLLTLTQNFYTFIFDNSFFYKFPLYYNSYMSNNWADSRQDCPYATNRMTNEYEPKCRPFFIQSMSDTSNVVINKPYKFAFNNVYGSDICAKSNANGGSSLMVCSAFNFNDVQLYRSQVQSSLNNRKIFILYSDGYKLNVVFSSDYFPQEYTSYGQKLGVNNNEENDFFEASAQSIFDKYMTNNTQSDATYKLKSIYQEMESYYKENIFNKLIKMINAYNIISQQITQENYLEVDSDSYYFNIPQTYDFFTNNNSIYLSKELNEDYYLLPITVNFNYNDDFKLTVTQKTNFYYLLTEKQVARNEKVSLFYSVIVLEFSLYFCFLLAVNVQVWVVFGMIYYFFFKGFLMPLKDINKLYRELFFINKKKNITYEDDEKEELLKDELRKQGGLIAPIEGK